MWDFEYDFGYGDDFSDNYGFGYGDTTYNTSVVDSGGDWWDGFDFSGGAGDSFSTAGPADDSWWDFSDSGNTDWFDNPPPLSEQEWNTPVSTDDFFMNNQPTGPGYYDEITGQFISDPNGGLRGPLTNETSGDQDSMRDWTVDPSRGTWSNSATGENFQMDPWNPNKSATSGADIMRNAGALPKSLLGTLGNALGNALTNATSRPTANTGARQPTMALPGSSDGSQQMPATGGATAPRYNFEQSLFQSLPIQTIASLMGPKR